MADPARFTYYALVCDFSPAPGMYVRRKLLIAVSNRALADAVAERGGAEDTASLGHQRLGFAIACAQRFCRERYLLGSYVEVVILSIDPATPNSVLEVGSPPHYVEGGIVWIQTEEKEKPSDKSKPNPITPDGKSSTGSSPPIGP